MTIDTATLTLTRRFIAKTEAGTVIAAALASVNAAVIVLGDPDQYLADLAQRLTTTRLAKASGGTQAVPVHMKVAAIEAGPAIDPATGELLSPATVRASLRALYGDAARVAVIRLDGAAPELVVVLEAPDGTLRARRHLDPTWRPAPEVGEAGGPPTHQRAGGEDRAPRERPRSPKGRDTCAICVTIPLVYAEDAGEPAAAVAEPVPPDAAIPELRGPAGVRLSESGPR